MKADSAEMLVRLQLQVNVALMGRADFTDIQYVGGAWYAWFLVDVDKYPTLAKGVNGTLSSTRRSRAG